MRKINKSASVPPTLKNVSAPTNPSEVRETVYRANDVRQQLMKDQFHKCAYCECRVTLPYNDVEHYRPKASYYWLAYEWSNLLYACSLCNRTYKKAFFPLVDESQKVTAPGSLEAEKPLLINPAVDIPTDHVKFRRHEIVGVTDKGRETIKLLHLNDRQNRPELVADRERLYEQYNLELDKIDKVGRILLEPGLPRNVVCELQGVIEFSKNSVGLMKSPKTAYSGMLVAQAVD